MKYLAVILLLLFACTKDDDGFRLFTVKAGHERSSHEPSLVEVNKNSLDFEYKTDESWVWTTDNEYFSYPGTAKIAGFSDGLHRNQSCRLGYRHNYGIGVVGLFVEQGSQYIFEPLDTVHPNQTYYCRLSVEGGYYVARQSGNEAKIEVHKERKWGYRLYPCMAGSYRLNHDWNVWIKFK